MARIAGVNIPNNQHLRIALTAIYGIGNSTARKICSDLNLDGNVTVADFNFYKANSSKIGHPLIKY